MKRLLFFCKTHAASLFFLNTPQVINTIALIVVMPIVLLSIPLAQYGQWQFMLALQSWGLIFSVAQITDGSKRGLVAGLKGTFFYALIRRAQFLLIPAVGFIFLGLYFLSTDRDVLTNLSWLSALFLYTNILLPTSIGEYLVAEKQFRLWSLLQILTSSLLHVLAAISAWMTRDIFFYVLVQITAASIITVVTLIILSRRHHLWQAYREGKIDKSCLPYGLRFLPIDATGAVANKLSDVLIGVLFGFSTLAIFSVANDLRNYLANILKIAGPLLYADFVQQPLETIYRKLRPVLFPIFLAGLGLSIVGWFAASIYIFWFLIPSLQQAQLYLAILSTSLPIILPNILLYTLLNAHFKYKELALASILPSAIKIILIFSLGIVGGVIGLCVALTTYPYMTFFFFFLVTEKPAWLRKFIQSSPLLRHLSRVY